jgi:hypothetical protein
LLRAATRRRRRAPKNFPFHCTVLASSPLLPSTSHLAQLPSSPAALQHSYRACFTRHYCSIAFVCLCTCIFTPDTAHHPDRRHPPSLLPTTTSHTRYRATQPPWFSLRIKSTSARRRSASSRTASAPLTGSDGALTLPRGSGLPVSAFCCRHQFDTC